MTDSKSLPDLPNKKNKTNWVEKRGGLPSYINRIAKHLHTEKGMETGHAIATAVNTVKKWCSGGTVSSTKGPEKSQHVTAATKAKACAAVAEWNVMKGTAGMNAAQDRTAYSDEEYAMVLAQEMEADLKLTQDLEEDPGFDMDAYELALSAERAESGLDPDTGRALELAIFDESKHRRDLLGMFRKMSTPDLIRVKNDKTRPKLDREVAETEVENRQMEPVREAVADELGGHVSGVEDDYFEVTDRMGGDWMVMHDEDKKNWSAVEPQTGATGNGPTALDAVEDAQKNAGVGGAERLDHEEVYNDIVEALGPKFDVEVDRDVGITITDRTGQEYYAEPLDSFTLDMAKQDPWQLSTDDGETHVADFDNAKDMTNRLATVIGLHIPFGKNTDSDGDGDSGGDTDNDGDGSRWAILGERGEVEYYDTQAEAEEAGEGQEALEITKDDKRYHVFYPGGHEIDVDSYDSYDAMMEDWDTGLEAGEAALHSPDPDNDGDSGVDTDNDGDGEAEWKDQLHALEVDRQAHEYEIVSQAVPAYIDVNVDQDAGFELVDTRNNRTYTLEPTDDNEWTLYSEESGREWKYTKLDQAVYGFIKAISPYQ